MLREKEGSSPISSIGAIGRWEVRKKEQKGNITRKLATFLIRSQENVGDGGPKALQEGLRHSKTRATNRASR